MSNPRVDARSPERRAAFFSVPLTVMSCAVLVVPAAADSSGCMHPVFPGLRYIYDTGEESVDIAMGDVDGVGGPDLAVANWSSNEVSVLLNQGDGTYGTAVAYDVGTHPIAIVMVDLDGVKGPDLAVANLQSEDISVLLNNGDGTFAASRSYRAGPWFWNLSAADLDGRNGPELIGLIDGNIAVFVNHGDGTFDAPVGYELAPASPATALAVTDLDGMNGPDVALSTTVGLVALMNQGDGTLVQAVASVGLFGLNLQGAADLDGMDGPDLVCGVFESADLVVFLNGGDGTFLPNYINAEFEVRATAIGDLDGFNGSDLAVVDSSNQLHVLLNQGGGEFAPGEAASHFVGYEPSAVEIGDADGIAGLDVVVSTRSSGNAWLFRNRGDGSLTNASSPARVLRVGGGPIALAAGDVDGAAGADLAIVSHHDDLLMMLLNQGEGGFAAPALYDIGPDCRDVAMADLDGVNGLDLAVARYYGGESVGVLLNHGDGTFAEMVDYGTGGAAPYQVVIDDVDGFNGPDLVAICSAGSSNLKVWLNQGDGTFGDPGTYGVGMWPDSIAVGDVDGVNGPDLVVTTTLSCQFFHGRLVCTGTEATSVMFNLGAGSFGPPVSIWAGGGEVTIGDLDGRNGHDIVVSSWHEDWFDGAVRVFLNEGSGSFAGPVEYEGGGNEVVVADFDGADGLDIGAIGSNGFWLLLNCGDGTFAESVSYEAGDAPSDPVVGEFDGVNGPDIAVTNFLGDSIAILLSLCAACTADLDGDGSVGGADLALLLGAWGPCNENCPPDLNGDKAVDAADLGILLGSWGASC